MTHVETSNQDGNLTEDRSTSPALQESTEKIIEPTKEEDKNWQAALQKSREREKLAQERADAAERELKEKRDLEKQRELANLSEAERLKAELAESEEKRVRLELRGFIREQIAGRDIPNAVIELITETPWAIPAVKRELGAEFTWDEVADSVKRHFPSYIESLVVKSEQPSGEPNRRVDTERGVPETQPVSSDHIYSREEVSRIASDPKEWEKHKDAIDRQMAKYGGKIPY